MQHPFLLKIVEHERSTSLRERMRAARCVFEFVVFSPKLDVAVDENLHRHALMGMDHYLSVSWELGQSGDYLPEYYPPNPDMDWDVAQAIATPLSSAEVRKLVLTESAYPRNFGLYSAFCDPPYRTEFSGGDHESKAVFGEWLQLLGIEAQEDVVVINWVSDYEQKWGLYGDRPTAERPWAEYFECGLEWWGIWCLTVWNPQKNTLSVLAASTSD